MTDKNPNEHDDPAAPTVTPDDAPADAAPLRKPTREEMRDMSDEEIMAAHGMELGPRLPAEFRLMAGKQVLLAFLCALAVGLVLSRIMDPEGPGGDSVFLWVAGLVFLAAGLFFWKEGRDPRPILVVDADGITDRAFGRIPWADIAAFRMNGSLFNPGFGYSLKKGVAPPKKAVLYKLQAGMNRLSALPERTFRKQMVAGGCDPMLLAFRKARPDLETR